MTVTVFHGVNLFDGVSPNLLEGMDIVVEGTEIREVSERRIDLSDARSIEAKGRTLMPGLIDAHVHVIAADPNLGRLDAMPSSLLAQHARGLMEAALMRGFTTLRDAGGADYGYAMAVKSGLIKGPRLFYAGRALTQTGGHADFRGPHEPHPAICSCGLGLARFGVVADGVPEVQRAAREELRKGASQIKIMASGGIASPSDPVWNLQYSEDEIRAIVWEAESWQTYVMAHAYTPQAIKRCVDYGVRTIEHGNLIDDDAAAFVASRGAYVVPTLATYDALSKHGAELGFPEYGLAKLKDVREAGRRSLEVLKNAGVKVGFGTDLLGDMHRYQATEFLIRGEVLEPAEILISATSMNAEILNASGRLGCVAPGALADLILVDGNPLDDLSLLQDQGRHIPLIMKDGEIYKNEL